MFCFQLPVLPLLDRPYVRVKQKSSTTVVQDDMLAMRFDSKSRRSSLCPRRPHVTKVRQRHDSLRQVASRHVQARLVVKVRLSILMLERCIREVVIYRASPESCKPRLMPVLRGGV